MADPPDFGSIEKEEAYGREAGGGYQPRRAGVMADVYRTADLGRQDDLELYRVTNEAKLRAMTAAANAWAIGQSEGTWDRRGEKDEIPKSEVAAANKLAADAMDDWMRLLEEERVGGNTRRWQEPVYERMETQVPEEYFSLGTDVVGGPFKPYYIGSGRTRYPPPSDIPQITYHPAQPGAHGPGSLTKLPRIHQSSGAEYMMGKAEEQPIFRDINRAFKPSILYDQRGYGEMVGDRIDALKAGNRSQAAEWLVNKLQFGRGDRRLPNGMGEK